MKRCLLVAIGILLTGSSCVVSGQPYPARPIRLIVPYPPGGNVDLTARIISPTLGELLGQTIVVDNRAGASGNIGALLVARSAPDGYTLLMGSSGPLSVNPIVTPNMPYDAEKDYAPISTVHVVPLIVLASQKSGITSVKELIDRAKAEPGKLTVASPGTGTSNHLSLELFVAMTGTKVLHVPYKGSGPALAELLGGQVNAMFDQLSASIGYVRDGRLRALAVTSAKRSVLLPNVPTLDESGLRGYEASTYIGVLGPAGMTKPVVAKLHAAMVKVMDTPAVSERFRSLGADPDSSSPEEFRKLIKDELEKWRRVAKSAGLKFE
ncbi:MAG TPA: tripartite tricarboxylate transporter substrate binding protein [Burkholderiales bacterium]|nr:tripartite tricarboxylate transporter substrate binding protein [Burkholderiales bacterium]